MNDFYFMQQALLEAQKAAVAEEVPIGAVLVRDGEIIARAHNTREQSRNPLNHAEMILLEQAGWQEGNWRLNDTTLYVTLEPCPMCLGALFQARVGRLVFGCADPKREQDSWFKNLNQEMTLKANNHVLKITGGILEQECSVIMKDFFKSRRKTGEGSIFDLLKKYDVPASRYTSYPTVLAWTEDVGEEDYKKSLRHVGANPLSLYFHLPFCENLCHFCGCMQVITKDHSRSREYTDILLREIDWVARRGGVSPPGCPPQADAPTFGLVTQFHFGGGTPNFLQPEELSEIVSKVREHFILLPNAEIAIEMHPRTSTKAFCDNLKILGFNRISLGVQDLDPHVQKLINRHQTYEMTRDMIDYLRGLGFTHFNIDLVYGLPGQTLQGWTKTLDQVLEFQPNRLAVYSYAHVPWARPVQRTFNDSDLPPPDMKFKLFETAYRTLTQNGYRSIGLDHFALKDDELCQALDDGTMHRNFMGYSTRAEAHQIGFGVSAISYVNGNYFQNQKDLKKYYEKIKGGGPATFRGFLLQKDDHLRRDLITQIMCRGSVDIPAFEKKWGLDFRTYFKQEQAGLAPFVEDNLLEISDSAFQVKNEGRLFLRNMAMVFDAYHVGIKERSKTPAFSRAV